MEAGSKPAEGEFIEWLKLNGYGHKRNGSNEVRLSEKFQINFDHPGIFVTGAKILFTRCFRFSPRPHLFTFSTASSCSLYTVAKRATSSFYKCKPNHWEGFYIITSLKPPNYFNRTVENYVKWRTGFTTGHSHH